MKLPDELSTEVSKPLGQLIKDNDISEEKLEELIQDKNQIVTVGDATTQKVISFGLVPFLQIIDGKTKRVNEMNLKSIPNFREITCVNPPGEIKENCVREIKEILTSRVPTRMIIEGEEDLLVLPVCINSSEGTTVLYGQPDQGMVLVKVTQEIKNKVESLLKLMD